MNLKKILFLMLTAVFYSSVLLFLKEETALYLAVLLVCTLALDQIFYSILPLVCCFYFPLTNALLLLGIIVFQLALYPILKKSRYSMLLFYIVALLVVFFVRFFQNGYSSIGLSMSLYTFVLYAVILFFHTFQEIEGKHYIIPYQSKIITLTLLLGYFLVLFQNGKSLLIYFLMMQLYLIKDFKYKVFFGLIYALLLFLSSQKPEPAIIGLCTSFFPPTVLLVISYSNPLWVLAVLYTTVVTVYPIKEKKITIEQDYIESLFQDFAKYTDQLTKQFHQSETYQRLKKDKIEEISRRYCSSCLKNTLCKNKPDKRYSFLSGAVLGSNQNIYDCPHYQNFHIDEQPEYSPNRLEYNGIRALADELNYLYHQSMALKSEYEHFLRLLSSYGYKTIGIDINLASSTLYFTLCFSKQKPIIQSLLIRLAYKAFGEELEIKVQHEATKEVVYFYKKPEIKITYAHTILAKNENLMSGDNYYIKKDYNSSYIFALSDGMGSGYNAYMESSDALKTISALSSYHFSAQTILRLLEDVYELKSNYDRYATLDFLYINTASRKMNLYKMGSTTTYILHNHQLKTYENAALPLKLDTVNSSYEIDLDSGDYIFLLSDGISDFISQEEFYSLVQNGNENVEILCDKIIQYMKQKENNHLKDDLSLIAIKAI